MAKKESSKSTNSTDILEKVEKICELVNKMPFNEMEYEEGDFRLKIVKEKSDASQNILYQQPMGFPGMPAMQMPAPPQMAASSEPAEEASTSTPIVDNLESDPNVKKITSPISGTFYAAPSPEAPPFISLGDEVQEGQIVCIMEAMKLMNEIKSPYTGKITKICYKNATGVPSGDTLFLVK